MGRRTQNEKQYVKNEKGVYIGRIENNERNGWGIYINNNGNKYEGFFENDKKHLFGLELMCCLFNHNYKYKIEGNKKGVIICEEEDSETEFQKGNLCLHDNRFIYIGNFRKGEKYGSAVLIDYNTYAMYNCIFLKNEIIYKDVLFSDVSKFGNSLRRNSHNSNKSVNIENINIQEKDRSINTDEQKKNNNNNNHYNKFYESKQKEHETFLFIEHRYKYNIFNFNNFFKHTIKKSKEFFSSSSSSSSSSFSSSSSSQEPQLEAYSIRQKNRIGKNKRGGHCADHLIEELKNTFKEGKQHNNKYTKEEIYEEKREYNGIIKEDILNQGNVILENEKHTHIIITEEKEENDDNLLQPPSCIQNNNVPSKYQNVKNNIHNELSNNEAIKKEAGFSETMNVSNLDNNDDGYDSTIINNNIKDIDPKESVSILHDINNNICRSSSSCSSNSSSSSSSSSENSINEYIDKNSLNESETKTYSTFNQKTFFNKNVTRLEYRELQNSLPKFLRNEKTRKCLSCAYNSIYWNVYELNFFLFFIGIPKRILEILIMNKIDGYCMKYLESELLASMGIKDKIIRKYILLAIHYLLRLREKHKYKKRSKEVKKKIDVNFLLQRNKIHLLNLIGRGGYSNVYKCLYGDYKMLNMNDSFFSKYCLNHIALKIFTNKKYTSEFFSELKILSSLRHPNVSLFYGALKNLRGIALEHIKCGSIFDVIHKSKTFLRIYDIIKMCKEITSFMCYLHYRGILHCDLKSSNILITLSGEIKICDFGLSVQRSSNKPKFLGIIGTYQWTAPEVLRGESYTTHADVYSFGVVLWEVLHRKIPFEDLKCPLDIIANVGYGNRELIINKSIPYKMRYILKRCLHRNKKKRKSFFFWSEYFDLLDKTQIIEIEENLNLFFG